MPLSKSKDSVFGMYFKNYLKETTVHGFRYVVEGLSVFERVSWTCVILAAISYAVYSVISAVHEYEANPVSTTFSSAPLSLAPFPKITVDGGNVWDPMGFTRQALRGAKSNEDDMLNKKFFFLSKLIFQRFYNPLIEYLDTLLTMKKYHALLNGAILNSTLLEDDKYGHVLYDIHPTMKKESEVHKLIVHLAALELDYPENIEEIYKQYLELPTCLSFIAMGKYVPSPSRQFQFPNTVLNNLINKGPTITLDSFLDCSQLRSTRCEKPLLKATSRALTLNLLDSGSQVDWTLGYILSEIWIRVFGRPLMSRVQNILLKERPDLQQVSANPKTLEKESRASPGQNIKCEEDKIIELLLTELDETELVMNRYLINVTKSMSNMELDLSYYELSLLLDFPMFDYCPYLHQANFIQGQLGCSFRKYRGNSRRCGTDQETKAISGCCKIRNQISQMHEFILRVMKHNQQAPQFKSKKEEHLWEFENASLHFGIDIDLSDHFMIGNKNPRIFACDWLNRDRNFPTPEECNLFHREFTNAGIGFSFNDARFEDMYKMSPFMEIFRNIMVPNSRQRGEEIRKLQASGPRNILRVVLQSSDYLEEVQKVHINLGLSQTPHFLTMKREFKIGINNPTSLPDLRSNFIEIKPGFQYKILITPVKYESDPLIETLSYKKRNCRMGHETEGLQVFAMYSQSGCILECQLKRALEICRCIPWNYPHFQHGNGRLTDVCDYDGNACVDQVMDEYNQTESITDCQCYPECDSFAYSYSISISSLDDICQNSTTAAFLSSTFYHDRELFIGPRVDAMLRGFIKDSHTRESDSEFCAQKREKIAMVEFQFIGQDYTIISRNVRTTFISALANLGGLVGLFTGMSLLSLFEMVFWLYRLIEAIVSSFRLKNSKKIPERRVGLTNLNP